jgi:transcriptional regulator with GAF, ATPase, and Fis domain
MPTLTYTPPGASSPTTIELYKQITTIGRGPENDICIPDPLLAEDHAHVQFDGTSFTVAVMHKKNDMQVNGRNRRQSTLKHGDDINMGATEMSFRMFSEATTTKDPDKPIDRLDAYKTIYQFSRELMQHYTMPELLAKLLDQVIELTGAERGFIIMVEGNQPKVAVGRNLQKENLADAVDLYSDSIVSRVIREMEPIIVSDALRDEQFKSSVSVVNLQLSSVMCAPLMERGKLLGVLYVGNSHVSSLFDQAALEVLTVFSAQASLILQNALLVNEMELDNQHLINKLEEIQSGGIIGSCDSITKILNKVRKVATTDVSVLVTGETGTGKELIARELHRQSNRKKGPFIAINCSAIPENLLESELFGHAEGAFTGANKAKIGKFMAADGGTIFLDELGEMPLTTQVKLLRVLEDKTITRVGDHRSEPVDIRIVAATNRDLEQEVQAGNFREDLFYRLNVITIYLPPLRERGEDVVLLARYFLQKFVLEYDRPLKGFTPQAMRTIRLYRWDGNIRQLGNHIRKAVILAEGTHIDVEDLDLNEDKIEEVLPLSEAKERFQSRYIREVLALNDGNRTKTARDLGVDPRTIFRHLEKEKEN